MIRLNNSSIWIPHESLIDLVISHDRIVATTDCPSRIGSAPSCNGVVASCKRKYKEGSGTIWPWRWLGGIFQHFSWRRFTKNQQAWSKKGHMMLNYVKICSSDGSWWLLTQTHTHTHIYIYIMLICVFLVEAKQHYAEVYETYYHHRIKPSPTNSLTVGLC